MYSVILVDDEPWVLLGIKNTFKWAEYGFEVIADTTDSCEALELIIEKKPDAVFMDIRMPELSGIELCRILKEKNIKTKVVFITGYADFQYAKEAIKYGVFEYCLKPIKQTDADNILNALKRELDTLNNEAALPDEASEGYQNVENVKFRKMLNYIHENYSKRLYLNDMAEQFQLNANYCCTLFKKNFDCNFSDYVTKIRMKNAADLLKNEDISINEVAEITGYDDYYYFNKVFKKYYGITPHKYRIKNS